MGSKIRSPKSVLLCEIFICVIFKLTIALLSMIFLLVYKKRFLHSLGGFKNLVDNWNTPFLMEIQEQQPNNGGCFDWQDKILNTTWPGTDKGCDCIGVGYCWRDGVRNRMSKSGCNYNETRCGCRDVAATPAQPLWTWPNEKSYCGAREKTISLSSVYDKMNEDGSCKSGYKKCGNPESISKGVCIPNKIEGCPITSIVLGKTNPDPTIYTTTVEGESISMFYSKSGIKNPLVDMLIGQETVCLDAYSLSWTPGRWEYPLMRITPDSKCEKDTRFTELTTYEYYAGEIDLFGLNNIYYHGLRRFTTSNNYKWKKFSRQLIELSPKAQCKPLFERVLGGETQMEKARSRYSVSTGLSIAVLAVGCIFGIFDLIMTPTIHKTKRSSKRTYYMIKYIPASLRHIFNVIYFFFVLSLQRNSKELSLVVDNSGSTSSCSDTFTNTFFLDFNNSVEKYGVGLSKWVLRGVVLGFIAEFIYYIWLECGCECEMKLPKKERTTNFRDETALTMNAPLIVNNDNPNYNIDPSDGRVGETVPVESFGEPQNFAKGNQQNAKPGNMNYDYKTSTPFDQS